MKNRALFFSTLAAGVFGVTSMASAFVPTVDGRGKRALVECPATTTAQPAIYHFDKVIFMLGTGNLVPLLAADAAQLNAIPRNTELDIKILDDPKTVAELKGKVLSFLGAANVVANRDLLRITDVEYAAVVCPKAP